MERKKYILYALRMCVEEQLRDPKLGLKKGIFEQRSYQQWASKEVLKAIEEYDGNPEYAIEDFMSKMDNYACKNPKSGMIFSIAYDTAVWMLDVVIALK